MRYLFAVAVAAVTVWSFLVPDAVGVQEPALARIFFWHFPCPIMATTLLVLYFSREMSNRERPRACGI